MNDRTMSRRRLLRMSVSAAASLPLVTLSGVALAEDGRVSEDDATAVALGYRHDTRQVDATRFPQHSVDQNCFNCQLYTGSEGAEWGACTIFPGKEVSAKGWCSAWVKKAS